MPVLRALFSLWRVRVGLVLSPLLALALWTDTPTDHLGYGAALIAALYASVLGGLVGAGLPIALRRHAVDTTGGVAAFVSVAYAWSIVAVIALGVLLHAMVAPACGPAHGVAYWALIPLPGAALAGLCGLALGASSTRRGVGTVLALAMVPLAVAWSLLRFYQSPAIFAYDPFYGFFPGALYDERAPLGVTLVTYRLGTLGWITAVASYCIGAWQPGAKLSRIPHGPAAGLSILGAAVGILIYFLGPSLGHRHDAADLESILEGRAWSRRCVVIYDAAIDTRLARATAADCDIRVAQSEDFFRVRHPGRLRVFLFRDVVQKQSLMGAADTYIAKPWRDEVYLQQAPFPHPVLKHEVAHAVAAAMARWPLRITTHLRVIPVPGLVEGAAVASAWEGESDVTPHQWARAMLEAGVIPRVSELTGLMFFTGASVSVYTAAGSFCRWLIETYGTDKFHELYASADFTGVYGRPLLDLERQWHAFLHTVPVSPSTLLRARTRFHRASVFGRQCPFERDDAIETAARHLSVGDLTAAVDAFTALVNADPTDLRARVAVLDAQVRLGDVSAARAGITAAGNDLGPAAIARLTARLGDSVWRWRKSTEADAFYAQVDPSLLDDDDARTLTLKRTALATGGPLAEALRDLLIGRAALDPSPVAAAAAFGELYARDPSPIATYLLGRQLFLQERDADARALLAALQGRTDVDLRVVAEATRLYAIASFRLGDFSGATRSFVTLAIDPSRPAGARDVAMDWLDRIARTRARAGPSFVLATPIHP